MPNLSLLLTPSCRCVQILFAATSNPGLFSAFFSTDSAISRKKAEKSPGFEVVFAVISFLFLPGPARLAFSS